MSNFPLRRVTESQLQQLGQLLWSWPRCEDCMHGKLCETEGCSSQRTKRLVRFFEHYKDLTASYETDVGQGEQPALNSHEDLFEIIRQLKLKPDMPRVQLVCSIFGIRTCSAPISIEDQDCAVNLAVRVMTMVNCSPQSHSSHLLELGNYHVAWRGDTNLSQYITNIFPLTDHPSINDPNESSPIDVKAALTARKLKKHARLKFRPTDDLRNHLKLDRKNRTVEIYHYTAFLKEHLRLTKDKPWKVSVDDSLSIGALPRQLVLEALDSVQKILFPLSDPKSRSFLLSLISTSSFDPDCLRFESASIRHTDEKEVAYYYFGARLIDLYEELQNPAPNGLIEKWLERKSGARHLMMATLVGVGFAVLLGMASLAVSAYQAWLGYQQWRHPLGSPNGPSG